MTRSHRAQLASKLTALTLVVALSTATFAVAAPTTYREPAQTGSEINVDVDSKTAEFRRNLDAKQQQLDELTAQLQALDTELEVAAEEYNGAVTQLEQMKATVAAAKDDLAKAEAAVEIQSQVLGDRASSMYRDGGVSTVEVLLESKSVTDLIARVKFLNTLGLRDADVAQSLKAQKAQLEQRVSDLEDAQNAASSLEFELKARKIEINTRIQERQDLLKSTQGDLVTMLEAEAARRKAEDSALLAEILAGANAKGIVVEPGSPVETALAYHGVPYLWGGETTSGFDCSGLVLYVFQQHGVTLPHYSGSQFQMGEKVAALDLQAGDVVFFGSPIHHVGIYIGGGYYIHAPRTGDFVKISKLADRSDFAGARRYAWSYRTGEPTNAVKTTAEALQGYR